MMSIDTIRSLNQEAAERSASQGLTPYVFAGPATIDQFRKFPYFGDYEPPGWEHVDDYFADSSGLGLPSEPALTADQLCDEINRERAERGAAGEAVGWAITSAGQFQVYVGEYVKRVRPPNRCTRRVNGEQCIRPGEHAGVCLSDSQVSVSKP